MLICMHTLRCAALRCINDIQPHNFTYNNTCCRWNEFSNLRFKYASYNAFKTRYPQSVDDQTISIQIHERPKENHKIPIGSCRMSIESGNMSVDIRGCLLPPVLLNWFHLFNLHSLQLQQLRQQQCGGAPHASWGDRRTRSRTTASRWVLWRSGPPPNRTVCLGCGCCWTCTHTHTHTHSPGERGSERATQRQTYNNEWIIKGMHTRLCTTYDIMLYDKQYIRCFIIWYAIISMHSM